MNGWLILITAAIPLIIGWVIALAEVSVRPDLRAGRRIMWVALLVVVPVVGLAVYAVVRPVGAEPLLTDESEKGNRRAVAVVLAAESYQRGESTASEYRAAIEAATST